MIFPAINLYRYLKGICHCRVWLSEGNLMKKSQSVNQDITIWKKTMVFLGHDLDSWMIYWRASLHMQDPSCFYVFSSNPTYPFLWCILSGFIWFYDMFVRQPALFWRGKKHSCFLIQHGLSLVNFVEKKNTTQNI